MKLNQQHINIMIIFCNIPYRISLYKFFRISNSRTMEIIVFFIGGLSYGLVEILYRGYTHWSMVLTGGAVILTFYYLMPLLFQLPLWLSALLGATIITIYEFAMGCVVNLWFKMGVWDYSDLPGNILGQICPRFSVCWFLLCLAFFALVKYNKNIFF